MNPARIALLGPFETHALRAYWPHLPPAGLPPPGMGGSCLVNLALARLDRGWPTDIITLDPTATQALTRYEGDGVRLWVVRRRSSRALRDGYRQEVAGLLAALAESRPDICHANWTYEYGLAALHQHIAPALVTVHDHAGHLLRKWGWRFAPHYLMSRRVMKRAACCTAVSPYISDYVERFRSDTVPVIPNLLSRLVLDSRAQPARPPTLISLLTWDPIRNAQTALRAFARFRHGHPEARYQLLGPGYEPKGPAETWARLHDLADGVLFMGKVPYQEALAAIARSTVLVHPSLEDSFGSPVAEAMALGVPVVAAREAGGPAWLCEKGAGHLVPGHSENAMAEAMTLAWREQRQAPSTSPSALDQVRARIMARCGPDIVLDQWNKLYQKLLATAP